MECEIFNISDEVKLNMAGLEIMFVAWQPLVQDHFPQK